MRIRAIAFVIVFLMTSLVTFAGGGREARDVRVAIRAGGSSVGGIFYVMSAAVASVVNEHVPEVNFTVQTTAGVLESYNRLVRGGLEVFVQNADIPYLGFHGGDPAHPTLIPSKNVRTWFVVEPSPFLVVSRTDNTRITRFEDVWAPGVRVGTRPRGNTPHTLLVHLTEFAGRDFDAINIFPGGHEQSAHALRDRNIDVLVTGSGTLSGPNSAHQEMASAASIRLFNFPDPLRDQLVREFPWWGKFTLPPNWLQGHSQPTEVVAILNSFFICSTVPDEIVYKMTKAVFANLDTLVAIAPTAFGTLNRQTASVNAVIPFHPGAARYFAGNGITVSVE